MLYSGSGNAGHYRQVDNYTGVADADPHQLVLMLLEGALGKIAFVKGLMAHGEAGKKGEVIGQAISIITGLRSSLDMSTGGELAANLDDLYDYMERRLVQANLKNDAAILDEVSSLLREIKNAWESIPQELRIKTKAGLAVVP